MRQVARPGHLIRLSLDDVSKLLIRWPGMVPPRSHCRVITVLNLKGGVGKTHSTWLLASVCQERGKRVLLIDTDAQGNLSNSFVRDGRREPGVEQLLDPSLDADVHSLIRRTTFPAIDILPASPAIGQFDLSDQRAWEKAYLHRSFLDPIRAVQPHYDFVVFDCPPRLSLASFAAHLWLIAPRNSLGVSPVWPLCQSPLDEKICSNEGPRADVYSVMQV